MNNLKRYIILIIPLMVFVFLGEMIIDNLSPSQGDFVEGYPVRKWGRDYMEEHNEIPHWFPNLFSGMPSYSAYSFSPSDPVGEILRPVLFNLGFKFWVYFSIGGVGMFLFLRRKKLGKIPALLGALSFALTPYLFGLINAGHGTKIFTFSYLPFIILAVDYILSGSSWKGVLYLGLVSAFQIWAKHPQIVYYTWMLVVFVWLWHQATALIRHNWSLKVEGKQNIVLVTALLLAGLLVIDPFASIMEFQGHSTRGAPSVLDMTGETDTGNKWEYATAWSLHPKETISFIYPYFYGLQNFPTRDVKQAAYWGYMYTTQSTYYLGLVVLLMAILGLILKKPDGESWLWLIASVIILFIGFGKYFPLLYRPLFNLAPLFSKFRVPSMIYILLPLTVGVLGARGLQMVLSILKNGSEKDLKKLMSRALIIFGSIAVISLLLLLFSGSISYLKMGQKPVHQQVLDVRQNLFEKGLLITLVISASCMAAIWMGIKKIISPLVAGILFVGVALADNWIVNQEFLNLSKTVQVERGFERARSGKVIRKLLRDKDHYRILPVDDPSSNFYGYFGISSISGYRPVKLRTYQDLMDVSGLNLLGQPNSKVPFSYKLEVLKVRKPILDMLNVKYIISGQYLEPLFNKTVKSSNIYENGDVLPRAWIVHSVKSVDTQKQSLTATLDERFNPRKEAVVLDFDGQSLGMGGQDDVEIVHHTENEITLKTVSDNGGLLVLSENYYAPRWISTIDGEQTPIYQTNHVLRSVYVPKGEHEVVFYFDDSLFKTTRLISRISLTLLLFLIVIIHREKLGELKRFIPLTKR